jgi:hypothetical protein
VLDGRLKITKNIGVAFLQLKLYRDAATAFESVVEASVDDQSGYNLVLCHIALNDAESAKRAFVKFVNARATSVIASTEDLSMDEQGNETMADDAVFANDSLRVLTRQRYLLIVGF